MDFNIKLSNGQVLKGMIQSPGENLKCVLILVHGIGEHIKRYSDWADLFCNENIGLTGVDLPGHGRSDGRRGNIKSFELLAEVLDIMINSCKQTFPGVPVFLYGHSLGGGIVLDYLIRKKPAVKGAIVTSPFLRLTFKPPRIKLILASLLSNVLPGLVQPSGLNVNHISHDINVINAYKKDPLVHDKISVGLTNAAFAAGRFSLEHADGLKVPVLLLHGSDDLITSPEGSKEFAAKSNMVELKIFEGGYHELHNEPFKKEVFEYILAWLNKMK